MILVDLSLYTFNICNIKLENHVKLKHEFCHPHNCKKNDKNKKKYLTMRFV